MKRVLASGLLLMAGMGLAGAGKPQVRFDAYVGKYPYDKVNGTSFLGDAALRAAVKVAVPSAAIRKRVLREDATTAPIKGERHWILMSSYEQTSAGDHNWSILGFGKGGPVAVCYASLAAFEGSRWYIDGRIALTKPDRCPSEMTQIPDELDSLLVHPDAVS